MVGNTSRRERAGQWRCGIPRAPLLAALAALAACTETPLNMAPIVDRSHGNGLVAAAAPAEAADGWYTVQKGDTLFHIAMSYHCGLRDLARWNGLDENAPLKIGQRLRVRDPSAPAALPAAAQAPVAPAVAADTAPSEAEVRAVPQVSAPTVAARALEATSLAPLAAPAGTATAAPPAAEGERPAAPAAPPPPTPAEAPAPAPAAPAPGATAATSWIWPVEGKVVTEFDPVHGKGIDLAVAEDVQVAAVADGTVSYTGSPYDYGNLVILQHPNGLRTVYAHLKSIQVQQGQSVARGQAVGFAGRSGAGAPVVHFEVRQRGLPVNPRDYLPPR